MNRMVKGISLLILSVLLLSLFGCVQINVPATEIGPMESLTETVALESAESVGAKVTLGAGELILNGGADALLEGDFVYNVPSWKPEIRYRETGNRGRLEISQPSGSNTITIGNTKYEWTLQLNNEIPTDLEVTVGAGKSSLDLRGMQLTSFDMEMGAGEVTMDFSGQWQDGFNSSIKGGVGRAVLYLPKDVGVRVDVNGGIGSVNTSGLSKDGSSYFNNAYHTSDVTLFFDIKAGIGEIVLEVRP